MNKENGVTLVSLMIYVVAMIMIASIVGAMTSFFYGSTENLNNTADNLGEFNKFNTAFLKEVKQAGNGVSKISENQIEFTSGNAFTFQDNGIYFNKIKICTGVKSCTFSKTIENDKTIITVDVTIGDSVPFRKNISYVVGISY